MKTVARVLLAKWLVPIPPTRKRMPCSARNTFCRETPFCTASVPGTTNLLPVGQNAQFRIQKDKMLLQVEDGDSKEREYTVVSMTPRQERKSGDNSASLK